MYIAAVLTAESQKRLVNLFAPTVGDVRFFPSDWTIFAHHMTVEFNKAHLAAQPGYFPEEIYLGMPVKLFVTHWKSDSHALAVVVDSQPSLADLRVSNKVPHITVAVAPGIKPFYSNALLESGGTFALDRLELDAHLLQVHSDRTEPAVDSTLATESYCLHHGDCS